MTLYRDAVAAVAAAAADPDDPDRARLAAVARRTFSHTVAGLYGLSLLERDLTGT